MAKEAKHNIKIENVGPIAHLEFDLAPGVTVLRGPNEAGKSTAIAAVEAIAGQKRPELAETDGAAAGTISGAGVNLIISRQAKNARGGKLEVQAVEDRIDLSTLVDPPVKDPKARTRTRVKALLSLTGATVSAEAFRALLPEGRKAILLDSDITADPIESAGKCKRRIEAEARHLEERAEETKGDVQRLTGQLEGLGELPADLAGSLTEAQAAREQAMLRLAEARGRTQQAENQANAVIKAQRELQAASAQIAEIEIAAAETRTELSEMETEREAVQRRAAKLDIDIPMAKAKLEALDKQTESWEALRAIAEDSPEPGPTSDEIDRLLSDEALAAEHVHAHQRAKEITETERGRAAAQKALGLLIQDANDLRAAGRAIDTVLAEAIDSPFFTIQGGDLFYNPSEDGREPEAYDRLSDGKRWTTAIEAIAHGLNAAEQMALVGISQQAWEGMDNRNRQTVVEAAIDANLAIVTAEHNNEDGLTTEAFTE